ncbi:MAG: endo-1,4-beta-xylanase [Spirochaetia bacterium]
MKGRRKKFVGNIGGQQKKDIQDDFLKYWDQITPGNAGKWGVVMPEPETYQWESMDNVYSFAKKNNLVLKQHTFVWGMQEPKWIHQLLPGTQKPFVEKWIKTFCERYPELDLIDVVNEPLTLPAPYRWSIGGPGETGWDWIVTAFSLVRAASPHAKLLINEHSVLRDSGKMDEYLKIVNVLKERELLDGIGLQGHFLEDTPVSVIEENLRKAEDIGLPVYISEFDVDIPDDKRQLKILSSIFKIFWNHEPIKGITFWGYRENNMWRKNGYLIRADGSLRPAMEWLMEYILER